MWMTAFPASSKVNNSRGRVWGIGRLGEVKGRGWARGRRDLMGERVWECGRTSFGGVSGSEGNVGDDEVALWQC